MERYVKFVEWVQEGFQAGMFKNQRKGQAYSNALRMFDPELSSYMTKQYPECDPFYFDGKLNDWLCMLAHEMKGQK